MVCHYNASQRVCALRNSQLNAKQTFNLHPIYYSLSGYVYAYSRLAHSHLHTLFASMENRHSSAIITHTLKKEYMHWMYLVKYPVSVCIDYRFKEVPIWRSVWTLPCLDSTHLCFLSPHWPKPWVRDSEIVVNRSLPSIT